MFEIVTTVKNIIGTCFYCSYKTGQFLVTILSLLLSNVASILSEAATLVRIILEDFALFLQDVWERLSLIISSLVYAGNCVTFSIAKLLESIVNIGICSIHGATAICHGLASVTVSVYRSVIHVVWLIKRLVILLGDGVWFIVTFLPISFGHLLIWGVSCTTSALLDFHNYSLHLAKTTQNLSKDVYDFVTDVPLESALGLIAGFCIIYVIWQFYTALLSRLRTLITYAINKIRHKYNAWKRQLQGMFTRQPCQTVYRQQVQPKLPVRTKTDPLRLTKEIIEDRYCVICQDRLKCVLILPCRHLCMCSVCSTRLQRYHATCPICREDIERTMKVFV